MAHPKRRQSKTRTAKRKENENGKKQQGGYELCKGKTVCRF